MFSPKKLPIYQYYLYPRLFDQFSYALRLYALLSDELYFLSICFKESLSNISADPLLSYDIERA